MTFNTYHWGSVHFRDSRLEKARALLASGERSDGDFRTLLDSDSVAAVGMAFDHYRYAESTTRFGGGNPFEGHEPQLLRKARDFLSRPALPKEATGAQEDGADHASALLVLMDLALPQDADLIAAALRKAVSINSLAAATMAAGALLERSDVPSQNLVTALRDITFDDSMPESRRRHALLSLGNAKIPQVADMIAAAAKINKGRFETDAAIILSTAHLSTHRSIVEEIVSTWPETVSYPEAAVLDALRADNASDTTE
ncbi:hypothetical protein ACFWDI_03075 [Streptomyces sp. NPDC060064]|uniref:hypothetical protein n=1 Tax=Streptomyces sp. NPDC060064 TaxID=3347049 RepID=UPI0036B6D6AD